jgi:hypothetical protein
MDLYSSIQRMKGLKTSARRQEIQAPDRAQWGGGGGFNSLPFLMFCPSFAQMVSFATNYELIKVEK